MLDDDGVVIARWDCEPTMAARERTIEAVSAFAGGTGVSTPTLTNLETALLDVLAHVFGIGAPGDAGGGTKIEAAADGEWLSVRLLGSGRPPSPPVEARLAALADRVEWMVDERAVSMTVLFEFEADAGGEAGEEQVAD